MACINRRESSQVDTALVFIHGSGDSLRIWQAQSTYFSAAAPARDVLALDLPGHGQCPDTLPTEASVADYAQSVHNDMQRTFPDQRPIIAGHSLGGAIALQLALDYPQDIGGIILIGTGARLRVLPALLDAARNDPASAQEQLGAMSVTSEHQSVLSDGPRATRTAYSLYRDLAACNRFDVMQRLPEIQLDTLILCGEEDRLTPVKFSHYLHEHLANSTLHIIADAGHYVMREQPARVNQCISNWLDQVKRA